MENFEFARRRARRTAPITNPAGEPADELERWLISLLRARGSMTMQEGVEQLAERIYRDAVRKGASAVDIGFFGTKLFHAEAASRVARGAGQWWTIDDEKAREPGNAIFESGQLEVES